MKMKSGAVFVLAAVPAVVVAESHCPSNCVDELRKVCETVDAVLAPIPFVPEWVKSVVGQSICFPKDSTPTDSSLCRDDCKILKTCKYVDSILHDIVVLPEFVRKITDTMICDIADLVPDHDTHATVFTSTNKKSKHCPKACTEEGAYICNAIEGVLEELQLLPEELLNNLGKAICEGEAVVEKAAERRGESLCPTKCRDDELHKVCELVDDILAATPTPVFVRNVTDHTICAIGELIPKSDRLIQLRVTGKKPAPKGNAHCPSNCADDLKPICEGVESILDPIPMIPEFVRSLVGHSICFPKDSGVSKDSFCPKDCSKKDEVVKVCNYVDNILHDVPVPAFVRNITDHAICAFSANAEAFRASSIQLAIN